MERKGEIFTYENCGRLWAYVPHFSQPGSHVYGYAFGELLTQKSVCSARLPGSRVSRAALPGAFAFGSHQECRGTARSFRTRREKRRIFGTTELPLA